MVSQRVEFLPERGERRDALDQRMVQFLAAAGFLAFPAPNSLPEGVVGEGHVLAQWLDALAPHAIVLTGGDDLGPHPDRDRTEGVLLAFASQRGLPLLGVCRGMQMMGAEAGVDLKPVAGHIGVRHAVTGAISGVVNSFHGLALQSCPEPYEVTALSEDGEIEAIRHKHRPWEGWMWHPEREVDFAVRDVQGLQALFGRVRA